MGRVLLTCSNEKCKKSVLYKREFEEGSYEVMPESEKCPFCGYFLSSIVINEKQGKGIPLTAKQNTVHQIKANESGFVQNKEQNTVNHLTQNPVQNEEGARRIRKKDGNKDVLVKDDSGIKETVKDVPPRRRLRNPDDVKAASIVPSTGMCRDEKIEKIISDCFERNHVVGMKRIQMQLNSMYYILNNENMKQIQGNKYSEETTIKNKHFLISGVYGSGKDLLTVVLADLLKTLAIRNKEAMQLSLMELEDVIHGQENAKKDFLQFLGDYDSKVIYFDENMDELFYCQGRISMDHQVVRTLKLIMREYMGKCTFVFCCSHKCASDFLREIGSERKSIEYLKIDTYSVKDAIDIICKVLKCKDMKLSQEAREEVISQLKGYKFDEDNTIGKFIDELFDRADQRQSRRIYSEDAKGNYAGADRNTFLLEDVKEGDELWVAEQINKEELERALGELNRLVGLEQVKIEVEKLVKFSQKQRQRRNHGLPVVETSLHLLFVGSAGTGKSTVARLIGSIYKSIGLLSKGHLVEKGLDGLVGDVEGATVKKTREAIDEAQGGVLFIDEAYSLTQNKSPYGKDAVDTLVKYMEDNRNDFMVIAAGYEKEMEEFVKSNSGLESRFSKKIRFEDYTGDELFQILELENSCRGNYKFTEDAKAYLFDYFDGMDGNEIGNARWVRNIYEALVKEHALSSDENNLDIITVENAKKVMEKEKHQMREKMTFEDAMEQLNALVGLDVVKLRIKKISNLASMQEKDRQSGKRVEGLTLHLVFSGAPGTGKTTVARLVGQIYRSMGLLSRGHIVEAKRDTLVAGYQGQTAIKTQEVIDRAQGGVLFIDEAYQLNRDPQDTFGQEAVEQLVTNLENCREDFVVIVAGYRQPMKRFIATNEGLKSRFNTYIEFPDYSKDELGEIFKNRCKEYGKTLEEKAYPLLFQFFERVGGKELSNARGVRNLYEKAIMNLAMRYGENNEIDRTEILAEDIQNAIEEMDRDLLGTDESEICTGSITFEEAMSELNHLIGLKNVKEEIRDNTILAEFKEGRKLEGKKAGQNTMHFVFYGAPGTGKTTVARLLGQIYRSIGLLSKGHVVEVKRDTLVGGYQGQTAIKTQEAIERAQGGILFIDEAYQLKEDPQDMYGQEAIDTLLKAMEDNRLDFMVIAAGYEDRMQEFINSNPGLPSRFSTYINFPDYSGEELLKIFEARCKEYEYKVADDVYPVLNQYFERIGGRRLSNARGVRNIFEKAEKYLARRCKEDVEADVSKFVAVDVQAAVDEIDRMLEFSEIK